MMELALAFGLALVASLCLTPLAIRAARRIDLLDRPGGFKAHAAPTPYLGGAAVLIAFALGSVVSGFSKEMAVLLGGAAFLLIVGTIDDRRTVPPLRRVLAAAAAATAVWGAGYGWSLFESDVANLAITSLWIIGLVNAFNLMDNIDGAAATLGSISAAGIGALALIDGNEITAAFALALSGACLGFLPYNLCSPAKIFLGDGGSMPVGFALAVLTLGSAPAQDATWHFVIPATLVVALPLFDTVLVVISRFRRGARLFSGNVDHLTHRLRQRLPSARTLAVALALSQALLCVVALGALELGVPAQAFIGVTLVGVSGFGIWLLESPGWVHPPRGALIGPGRGRPIRVLRVIARMNVGGPAYHVSLLSGRLDPHRYDTLLVSGNVGPGEASFAELADQYGARLETIPSLGPEVRPLSDIRALFALTRIVRRFRPDIVHTHTAKAGLLGRTAALFAGRRRPVIVHTYHGHVLEGYFGRLQSALYRILERWLGRVSHCLIGVSKATVDDLVRLGIANPEKFRVIPLGLELDRFTKANGPERTRFRAELGVDDEDVLLAYVGRLVPIKRVDRAIRAVAEARAAGAPVRLAVVGDGVLREELEAFAESLGLNGHVSFLGYRSDLEAVTAGCDAALLTSDNEGTPVALIEAAAAGRPAIATSVGGVPEVVGDAGILVRADDPSALVNAIVHLARTPGLRDKLGARALGRVLPRFASERLLGDMDDLYCDSLAVPSRGQTARPVEEAASEPQSLVV
jgi:UDP-N-acetylmuramyl pentapeptide phosphotransferase/UDP-N-acetylglucosamine-1-phosphate transferase/glycosyltransferase involved in cell wall biosynthesis